MNSVNCQPDVPGMRLLNKLCSILIMLAPDRGWCITYDDTIDKKVNNEVFDNKVYDIYIVDVDGWLHSVGTNSKVYCAFFMITRMRHPNKHTGEGNTFKRDVVHRWRRLIGKRGY